MGEMPPDMMAWTPAVAVAPIISQTSVQSSGLNEGDGVISIYFVQ